jgi:hypothetical protein
MMNRMKLSMLIAALAAVALASVGCEQKVGGDKMGKTDQANPSMMGKAPGGDQTAQSSPPSSSSSSTSNADQSKPEQSASSSQMAPSTPPPSDQDKSKAPDQEKKS